MPVVAAAAIAAAAAVPAAASVATAATRGRAVLTAIVADQIAGRQRSGHYDAAASLQRARRQDGHNRSGRLEPSLLPDHLHDEAKVEKLAARDADRLSYQRGHVQLHRSRRSWNRALGWSGPGQHSARQHAEHAGQHNRGDADEGQWQAR